jgi:CubicO group peptidase (beta-lactamase class C family)
MPRSTPLDRLRERLEEGVRQGVFPMAAAYIAWQHEPWGQVFAGGASSLVRWDVASLTKPMAVVTRVMRGVAEGTFSLEERLAARPGARPFALHELLGHRSGLPAWFDLPAALDRRLGAGWAPGSPAVRDEVSKVLAELSEAAVPGPCAVYSDLGFMLLGWHLEERLGRPLRDLGFGWGGVAPPADPEAFAPGGSCPRRGRRLRGEVNDINAWLLGGAAGHAGIFATLEEVGAWALDLERAAAGCPAMIDAGVVRDFWSLERRLPGDTWVLGWDTPTPGGSSAGQGVSRRAVGHLGFTGTSVWIDPEDTLVVVLLTNRVELGEAAGLTIKRFRPEFHDAVRDAVRWSSRL